MLNVGAVVVLYHPDLKLLNRMLPILSNTMKHVVLVDNSGAKNSLSVDKNVHYFWMGENVGIAHAQNTGLKYLIERSCDLAFLFDQDSTISTHFIDKMVHTFISQNDAHLAAIGPQVVCEYNGTKERPRIQKPYKSEGELIYVKQIISSGMLIDVPKLSEIGMKEGNLFIDGVDHEWCWRAAQHHYCVAIASGVEMIHKMGIFRRRFLGISYKVGDAIRHFYQVRNILILMKRPYVPVYWKIRNFSLIFVRLILVILQGDNKVSRVKYMLLGFRDGVLGRGGKFKAK